MTITSGNSPKKRLVDLSKDITLNFPVYEIENLAKLQEFVEDRAFVAYIADKRVYDFIKALVNDYVTKLQQSGEWDRYKMHDATNFSDLLLLKNLVLRFVNAYSDHKDFFEVWRNDENT